MNLNRRVPGFDGLRSARRRTQRAGAGPRYEQRIVLFIDFLGFKDLVRRTVEEPELLARMLSAIDAVGRIGRDLESASQRITQFSDSIVVSYRADEGSAVFWLLNEIAFCVIDLVERGFLLRGAVTVGPLLHDERHLIGPAMVRAYEMESRVALYPRVIVDPALLRVARASAVDNTPDEEEDFVSGFLTNDDDGQLFFDYIGWQSVVAEAGGDDDKYPAYLAALCRILEKGLRHTDPSVLRKYLWLHRRYLLALGMFGEASAGYKRDHPENVAAILRLPRLETAADAALRTVQSSRVQQGFRVRRDGRLRAPRPLLTRGARQ